MRLDDRRRGILLGGDRDMFVASMRVVEEAEPRVTSTLLATAGDRLALRLLRFVGTADGGGAIEAETLSLLEVDIEGRITAIVSFDPEDRRAASAEMSARFMRGGEVPSPSAVAIDGLRGLIEHDLAPLRAALSDDFVLDDYRRAGLGRIEGADLFARSFEALFEPDDLATARAHFEALCAARA